jgi:hypothetical protein
MLVSAKKRASSHAFNVGARQDELRELWHAEINSTKEGYSQILELRDIQCGPRGPPDIF